MSLAGTPTRVAGLLAIAVLSACTSSGGGGGGGSPGGGDPPIASTYAIGGTVTGPWVAGVTVTLGGDATAVATTDPSGAYTFSGLASGSYTITPSLAGWTFQPPTTAVTVNGASVTQAGTFATASTLPGHSVSGTVTYAGSMPGRVYVRAWAPEGPEFAFGDGSRAGTTMAAPGPYTIRGLPPGSYTIIARRDVNGQGEPYLGDPFGAVGPVIVTSTSVSVTGVNVVLTDPQVPAPAAPSGLAGFPGSGVLYVHWDDLRAPDPWGGDLEAATSYALSWGTDLDATNLGSMTGIPARDDEPEVLLPGLTDGAQVYAKVRAFVGATPSAWSAVAGPFTVGAPAGGSTVSGTVSFPGSAAGPLYVAIVDPVTDVLRLGTWAAPASSPAPFSVPGVPDGRYKVYAIIDQDGDHLIDEGDLRTRDEVATVLDVAGPMTGVDVALDGKRGVARVATWAVTGVPPSFPPYMLEHRIREGARRPVSATVVAGPNIPLPLDLAQQGSLRFWSRLGATAPAVGDTYTYVVSYADGTTETLTAAVTGAGAFPTGVGVTTSTPYSPGVPLFTWAAPASPPASFGYAVQVVDGVQLTPRWTYPADEGVLPSTTTAVRYDADGAASTAVLGAGSYLWGVQTVDAQGNRATAVTGYLVP